MRRTSSAATMPYPVQAALVDASGKVFWYWEAYKHFLRKCGVNGRAVSRLAASRTNKYELVRQLLAELDGAGVAGRQVQGQLVEGLVGHPLSDADGIDVAVACAAQQRLRAVAQEHGIVRRPASAPSQSPTGVDATANRHAEAQRRERDRQSKESRDALHAEYCRLLQEDDDKQGRGYRLEEILGEVARLDGLRYIQPSRKGTVTQTDCMIGYDGFQYLVEARWRDTPADVGALAKLAR